MGTQTALHTQDFYAWLAVTAGLLRAGKWQEIDASPSQRSWTRCARRNDEKPYGA